MVHPTGMAFPGVNQLWSDDVVASYRQVADAVHAHGAAMVGQLSHLGRQGHGWARTASCGRRPPSRTPPAGSCPTR